MAKLDSKQAEGEWGFKQGEPVDAWLERERKSLQKYEKESDALLEGQIVGGVVQFPVADGYAIYRVSKEKPLTLQHIPYCDAWQIPEAHMRGLTRKDIERLIWQNKQMNDIFGKQKNNLKEEFRGSL